MPLYFFDTDDGTERFRDDVGTVCADDQAARNEASHALAELAREFIPGNGPQKNMTMWVRNADGSPLLELSISFAIKPLA